MSLVNDVLDPTFFCHDHKLLLVATGREAIAMRSDTLKAIGTQSGAVAFDRAQANGEGFAVSGGIALALNLAGLLASAKLSNCKGALIGVRA